MNTERDTNRRPNITDLRDLLTQAQATLNETRALLQCLGHQAADRLHELDRGLHELDRDQAQLDTFRSFLEKHDSGKLTNADKQRFAEALNAMWADEVMWKADHRSHTIH
jgi:hypothetical protein